MWFDSPFTIGGKSPTWRDDMIQLIYSLIYLLNGLKYLVDKFSDKSEELLKSYKLTTVAVAFCKDLDAQVFEPMLNEVYNLNFYEKPDYDKLQTMFREAIFFSSGV